MSNLIKTVALAGNPNSGKTTIFNSLTRLKQKVGNYPGVTVEKKSGRCQLQEGHVVEVIDLPGAYSLAVRSPDEKVARDVLLGKMPHTAKPDVVVCILDASNIERNFYLTSQIMDLGIPVIIALNMMDEARRVGKTIDVEQLQNKLNVPIVPMIANQQKGVVELKEALSKVSYKNIPRPWRLPEEYETGIQKIAGALQEKHQLSKEHAFSEALILMTTKLRALEYSIFRDYPYFQDETILKEVEILQAQLKKSGIRWRSAAVESRYRWIKAVLQNVVTDTQRQKDHVTEKLDAVLTHKIFGWLCFVGVMALMFFTIFTVASYPMDWIDMGFGWLAEFVSNTMPKGVLRDLIVDGIIAGVGGVVIFLPQILILFFFIGFLQDTGYMARAAFIMDRVMSKVGLHGKSFIPLLSSYACAIPGIMSARTIESPKDRLVTILVAPLMSCSARLPVYTLMIAVLMPYANAFEKTGIMMLMYFIGTIGACFMAFIFKRFLVKGEKPSFILELPPYRMPSIKTIIMNMWERSRLFLKRAGTVILTMSIILWALMTYPQQSQVDASEALKHTYAGRMGQVIEPVIKPLGYDWRIGIGLIGSFAAREVFVSTMSIVFNIGDDDTESLQKAFEEASWPDGEPLFTPLVCLSLMVFFVFALQCLSTIAVVWRETNTFRWPFYQLIYMTALAYFFSLLVYQGGRALGFS
ncbi:MAG: ferrous iron transport protein B [Candidatus Omnitrophica bacterium]|nr:ferrous iron transport protein B [Candidatus Omnitrophota bacterium]